VRTKIPLPTLATSQGPRKGAIQAEGLKDGVMERGQKFLGNGEECLVAGMSNERMIGSDREAGRSQVL
jgi:hypothetical protein